MRSHHAAIALSFILIGRCDAFGSAPIAATKSRDRLRTIATSPRLSMHRRPALVAMAASAMPLDDEPAKADLVAAAPVEEVPIVSVVAVLLAAFLNLLGFTMMIGFTPALGAHFGLDIGPKFGSLTSAYPIGMLAGVSSCREPRHPAKHAARARMLPTAPV